MNILISATNLATGGPSVFLLRLADQLSKNHKVGFYEHYHYYSDTDYDKWSNINFFFYGKNKFIDQIVWKLNALLKIFIPKIELWETLKNHHFKKTVRHFNPDIILTTQQKTDGLVIEIAKQMRVKVALRLNSSYGLDDEKILPDNVSVQNVKKIFSACDGIIYTSDFHFNRVIKYIGKPEIPLVKIMNGMPPVSFSAGSETLLYQLGIDKKTSFIFGMVSRGEKEKGWKEAIEAFRFACNTTDANLHLILVGQSDYLDFLKEQYQSDKKIHFVGFCKNPPDWIQFFDVALLPTYFVHESTPNVIIEYLSCGKPVIATDYVEIPDMIKAENETAGTLIPLNDNGKPDVRDIARAMTQYINNRELWQRHVNFAHKAAAKFDMEKCAAQYESFFKTIIGNN